MSQQTDDVVINMLLNDQSSADMLTIANTADTLKTKIELLKRVFEQLQLDLNITAREAEQGVVAYDRFIAAADRAAMVNTPARINQQALGAVTTQSLVPPEAKADQVQVLALQEQERMRYQELQLQWEEHFRQVRIANEQQYREFVTTGQDQIAQQRLEQQQQYQNYVQQGNTANQQQRLEQQQQYQNYVLQGTQANQQQRLAQEQQYRMFLMEGTQATQQERLAQAQQYLSYVQQGNEAAAQAQIAQNQQYQQYVQQGNAANQAQRMEQQQQYQAYLLEGTAANTRAQLAQAQQYQAYLLEGNTTNQAERLAQAQQYQQYVLQGNLAAARTQMEQNQQYQQWLITNRQTQTQAQLEQTRQIQERELLAQQEVQQRRMVGIQTAAEAEMLADQQNHARDLLAQREIDFMRANSARLVQINTMIPANQINPLAQLFTQAKAAGLDLSVVIRMISQQFGQILPTEIQKATKEMSNMRNGLLGMAREAFNLSAVMNTLFGVGMAMIVFQLTQLVTNFLTTTIKNVELLQNSITSMSGAEKSMSKSGVEVTGGELLDIALRLQKVWTNISKIDLMDATGSLALKLSDKGISPEQIEKILQFALSRRILYPEKSLSEIVTTTSSALLSNNYEGVNTLGAGMNQKSIDNKAKQLGLINETNKSLTEQQTIAVKILLLEETTNANLDDILAKQNDLANASNKLAANWLDLTGGAGPFVDAWNTFLFILANALETLTQILFIVDVVKKTFAGENTVLSAKFKILVDIWGIFSKIKATTDKVGDVILRVLVPGIMLFRDAVKSAWEYFVKIATQDIVPPMTVDDLKKQDTATGTLPSVLPGELGTETEDTAKKITSWLSSVQDAMDGFADKARNMAEDFTAAMKKMAEDFNTDKNRFLQDWAIDRIKIITDSNDAIAKKEKDYRDKQKDEEAKFQEQLRQLRESYLFSLEDALHERDARAILRLAREYAMNKQNMINERNLNVNSGNKDHVNEMARLRKEKADRLKELDSERALKLARMTEDYNTKVRRAYQEHNRDIDRLEHERQDKIKQLTDTISQQLNLNAQGSKAIYDLLNGYYGPKGVMAALMAGTYKNTETYITEMTRRLLEFAAKYKAVLGGIVPVVVPKKPDKKPPDGMEWRLVDNVWIMVKRSGGISSLPSGVSSLPLNTLSTMFGAATGTSTIGQSGGKMELMVTLSPDLETRIVNKSLDNMSSAIMQVRKARS